MKHPRRLPSFELAAFAREIRARSPVPLSDAIVESLWHHYQELERWSPRLALIGPGSADDVLDRHFGEALAALPLLPPVSRETRELLLGTGGHLLDIGSGAGFPGLVLAAARPDLTVTLVEPRQRKWAFLKTAARHASLPCRCLDARVDLPLPEGVPDVLDVVTVRALKLPAEVLAALAGRLGPAGRFLLWVGREVPGLPPGLTVARSVPLPGSEHRRIVEVRPDHQGSKGTQGSNGTTRR